MRWVKGRSLVLYTCVMDDTEGPSTIVKNSEASNSYCGVADRRWLLPAISDKQQKRPISTLTTDHKTCMKIPLYIKFIQAKSLIVKAVGKVTESKLDNKHNK